MKIPTLWLNALRASPLLASLGTFDFEVLTDTLQRREFSAGHVLFRQGDPGDSLMIVVEGLLDVKVREMGGAERLVTQLGPGQVVGEMSCVDPAPRSATVTARERTWVFALDRNLLLSLQTHAPAAIVAFYRGLIKVITERLRETDEKISNAISSFSAEPQPAPPPRAGTARPAAPRARPLPYKGRLERPNVPAMAWLPTRDYEMLQSMAPPVVYTDGMDLYREGDIGADCALILRGRVAVFRETADGRRRLATLEPGAFVGQMALVDRIPRSATVTADGDVVAMLVARDIFERLLASASSLGILFQEQIAVAGIRQLRMADARLAAVFQPRPGTARNTAAERRANAGRAAAGGFIRTALQELSMSMADLDKVEVVRPDGIASAAEIRARTRRG